MIKLLVEKNEIEYWVDDNNNKWDVTQYTEEEAEKLSKTLINCKDCINCENCINCQDCESCIECDGCFFEVKEEKINKYLK